ncbi:hypothetical protein BT63DRAFT_428700 [Microthyrium microscopicum]|uniref:Uncharacterized protein n=1 Tax=Microthyrium microscopicum TaxID=703497 RepID=A0A6A6U3P1_9PEZI|nr:hypothetical protein BT63DRAFT_428700 [Microthyrium microscopicum]
MPRLTRARAAALGQPVLNNNVGTPPDLVFKREARRRKAASQLEDEDESPSLTRVKRVKISPPEPKLATPTSHSSTPKKLATPSSYSSAPKLATPSSYSSPPKLAAPPPPSTPPKLANIPPASTPLSSRIGKVITSAAKSMWSKYRNRQHQVDTEAFEPELSPSVGNNSLKRKLQVGATYTVPEPEVNTSPSPPPSPPPATMSPPRVGRTYELIYPDSSEEEEEEDSSVPYSPSLLERPTALNNPFCLSHANGNVFGDLPQFGLSQYVPPPSRSVNWTNDKVDNAASPGPNTPPKYSNVSTEAPKSALKPKTPGNKGGEPIASQPASPSSATPSSQRIQTTQPFSQQPLSPFQPTGQTPTDGARSRMSTHQLESYERKMSEVNKYAPKQPSGLRTVARNSNTSISPGSEASSGILARNTVNTGTQTPALSQQPSSDHQPISSISKAIAPAAPKLFFVESMELRLPLPPTNLTYSPEGGLIPSTTSLLSDILSFIESYPCSSDANIFPVERCMIPDQSGLFESELRALVEAID